MRILQMSAFADRVGGAEIYMHNLSGELTRRGHVVGHFGTAPDRHVDEEQICVVQRPRFDPTRLVADDAVCGALDRFIARFRPDVIHLHNLYSLALDVDRMLHDSGLPVLQTVHDFTHLCPNAWCVHADGTPCPGGAGARCFQHECQKNYPYDAKLVLLTLLRCRMLASFVDVMICPSTYLTQLIRNHGFDDVRHIYLYYFIDDDQLAEPMSETREEQSLLFIGRLDAEKGVTYLLDAMPRILADVPGTTLTVVGDGSRASELRQQARDLGLGEAVTFHPWVPHEEVKAFYARATLNVLPSIWCDNSPIICYECMVAGLPIVGSRMGGIPDLVVDGESGYLVNARDPQDIADKVVRLLRAPEDRARMAKKMRERARTLTRREHVNRIEAVYQEIAGQERPERPARSPLSLPIDNDLMITLQQVTQDLQRLDDYACRLLGQVQVLEKRGPAGWMQQVARLFKK